jgi:hypothetical protein
MSSEMYLLVSGRETMTDILEESLPVRRWRGVTLQITGGHGERGWTVPMLDVRRVDDMVEKYKLDATKAVLAERERELLELKGPCSEDACPLHYAHAGPCDVR